jgi:hypothetical protein
MPWPSSPADGHQKKSLSAMMLDRESPRARYRRLAQDCLETAQTIQNTEARTTLIEMEPPPGSDPR